MPKRRLNGTPERRLNGEDRRHVSRSSAVVARVAWRALITLVLIETLAILTATIIGIRDHTAINRAQVAALEAKSAVVKANSALASSSETIDRLEAEALGLCRAAKNTRAYVDKAHEVLHRLTLEAAAFVEATAKNLSNGISRGVRHASLDQNALSRAFVDAASQILYLAPTDCDALTANPLSYRDALPTRFK